MVVACLKCLSTIEQAPERYVDALNRLHEALIEPSKALAEVDKIKLTWRKPGMADLDGLS